MRNESEKEVLGRLSPCVIRMKKRFTVPARKYETEIIAHDQVADSRHKSADLKCS
jgi:hypothetical protein